MARKTTAQATNFNKADAFLRLSVVDNMGEEHRLPKDLALQISNHVSANLVAKAEADPDFKFNLIGTVHVVDNTPKDDINF